MQRQWSTALAATGLVVLALGCGGDQRPQQEAARPRTPIETRGLPAGGAGSFFIATDAGIVTLESDARETSETYHVYEYEGILRGTPFHGVHVSYVESSEYLLLHRKTGQSWNVDARPLVSPDGRHLAVGALDLEAMMSPNSLTIYDIDSDTLSVVFREEPLDWGPDSLRWAGPSTLSLTRVLATDRGPGEYGRIPAELVRSKTGWAWAPWRDDERAASDDARFHHLSDLGSRTGSGLKIGGLVGGHPRQRHGPAPVPQSTCEVQAHRL